MYCPECLVTRPGSHTYCFDCGTLLKGDHQDENLLTMVNFVSQRKSGEFFNEIKRFADEHPENPYAQKIMGNALFHKGKLTEAESRYRSAMNMDPDNIDYMYDLGIVLYYQARLTEAMTLLEKLLKIDPEYSAAHYRLGLIYYHLGQFEEAAEHFKKCTTFAPDFVMAHFHLGVVYSKMGKIQEAIEEFNHQLDRNLKDAACRHHLEELFVQKWKKEEKSKY